MYLELLSEILLYWRNSFVAGTVEPYLTTYQTDKPMLPFMYANLMELVRNLLKHFIESRVVENCRSGSDLKKVDVNNAVNHIKKKDKFVGFSAENSLLDLKRKVKSERQ